MSFGQTFKDFVANGILTPAIKTNNLPPAFISILDALAEKAEAMRPINVPAITVYEKDGVYFVKWVTYWFTNDPRFPGMELPVHILDYPDEQIVAAYEKWLIEQRQKQLLAGIRELQTEFTALKAWREELQNLLTTALSDEQKRQLMIAANSTAMNGASNRVLPNSQEIMQIIRDRFSEEECKNNLRLFRGSEVMGVYWPGKVTDYSGNYHRPDCITVEYTSLDDSEEDMWRHIYKQLEIEV
jgi:hypothetical protein